MRVVVVMMVEWRGDFAACGKYCEAVSCAY